MLQVQGVLLVVSEKRQKIAIGALSGRTGVNIETIRYYERIGLLPLPPRTEGGHRLYSQEHLKRLSFIRQSRALGFTLDEIRVLLGLVDGGDYTCAEVQAMTLEHLGKVRRKIGHLKSMERVLEEMAAQCSGGKVAQCPIVEALFNDAS